MSEAVDTQRLRDSLLGRELDEAQAATLASQLGDVTLADGETLVREGDADHRLFLLADGALEVVARPHGTEEVVHVMKPGELAGTRAFIDRSPRQATLRARRGATVYTLAPEDFEALVESDPWLVYRVLCAIFRITHVNLMRMNRQAEELVNYVTKTHGRY